MSDIKIVKGRITKPNCQLWDRAATGGRKIYNYNSGIVDVEITRNVISWVEQGLMELVKDDTPVVKEDDAKVVEEPVKEVVSEPVVEEGEEKTEEPAPKKASKKKSKKKSSE